MHLSMGFSQPASPNRGRFLRDCAVFADGMRTRLRDLTVDPSPYSQTARQSAVLLPLFADDAGAPHLLFTQRATTLAHHSGEISFPGGRQDATDLSLEATALREAYEEIGLEPQRVTILGQLPPVFTFVSNYLIAPFLGLVDGPSGAIAPTINPAEVDLLIDAPLLDLANPAIARVEHWRRLGRSYQIYFYQLGPHRIWGATARIVYDLLTLLPDDPAGPI